MSTHQITLRNPSVVHIFLKGLKGKKYDNSTDANRQSPKRLESARYLDNLTNKTITSRCVG